MEFGANGIRRNGGSSRGLEDGRFHAETQRRKGFKVRIANWDERGCIVLKWVDTIHTPKSPLERGLECKDVVLNLSGFWAVDF